MSDDDNIIQFPALTFDRERMSEFLLAEAKLARLLEAQNHKLFEHLKKVSELLDGAEKLPWAGREEALQLVRSELREYINDGLPALTLPDITQYPQE